MTTAADWITETGRHLRGTQHSTLNLLASNVSDTVTTIPVTYDLGALQAGSVIAVDLEVMYVWTVDTAAKTATVQRGMQGSTPAAHTSGAVITVNPRFSDWEIFAALNSELRSLSAQGIYQIRTLDLTAVSGQMGYDFPTTGYLGIADIRWQLPGTVTNLWPEISDYEITHNLPTTGTFPSGSAIFLDGELPTPQYPVRIRYKATLGALTSTSDDVSVTGLADTALDIPPLGAALRLLNGRPVGRAQYDAQGDTRRPDEVRVSEVLQAPAALRAEYQQRIADEAARLRRQWPDRGKSRVLL